MSVIHGERGELIARAVLDDLSGLLLPAVARPARLVPLTALRDDRISQATRRCAAKRGRLPAVRGPERQWRSARKWVAEELRSRYERR